MNGHYSAPRVFLQPDQRTDSVDVSHDRTVLIYRTASRINCRRCRTLIIINQWCRRVALVSERNAQRYEMSWIFMNMLSDEYSFVCQWHCRLLTYARLRLRQRVGRTRPASSTPVFLPVRMYVGNMMLHNLTVVSLRPAAKRWRH